MNIQQFFSIFHKGEFVDWDRYKANIGFIDDYNFQKDCRKETIRNMPGIGGVD